MNRVLPWLFVTLLALSLPISETAAQSTSAGTPYIDARAAFMYDPVLSGFPVRTTAPLPGAGPAEQWSDCPQFVTIYIHGFNVDIPAAESAFDTVSQNLAAAGLGGGAFLGFSWPSVPIGPLPALTEFMSAETMADIVGAALGDSIFRLWQKWPTMPIFILSHSLGARVVLKAFQWLNENHYSAMNCVVRTDFLAAALSTSVFLPKEEFAGVGAGHTPAAPPGTTPGGGTTAPTPIKIWTNPWDTVLRDLFKASEFDPGGQDTFIRFGVAFLSLFWPENLALGGVGPTNPRPGNLDECYGIGKIKRSGQDPQSHSSYIQSIELLRAIVDGWSVFLP